MSLRTLLAVGLLSFFRISHAANNATGKASSSGPSSTLLSSLTSTETPTITTAQGSTQSACCFVLQDTVTEVYWDYINSHVEYQLVNLTSITTFVTPLPSTTSTQFETNVYTTNITLTLSTTLNINIAALYSNDASFKPSETVQALNGSGTLAPGVNITTAGVTIASPTAFWVYSTVKVITAAAVTDSNGQVLCGTTSSNPDDIYTGPLLLPTEVTDTVVFTITRGVTSYATIGSGLLSEIGETTTIQTSTDLDAWTSQESEGIYTTTSKGITYTNMNSNAQAYFASSEKPTGVVISLSTPYISIPKRGITGSEPLPDFTEFSDVSNYGYPVQELIDFLAADPNYAMMYPGIGSCLPAGPEITPVSWIDIPEPAWETAGGDLTSGTIITITPSQATDPETETGTDPPPPSPTPELPTTEAQVPPSPNLPGATPEPSIPSSPTTIAPDAPQVSQNLQPTGDTAALFLSSSQTGLPILPIPQSFDTDTSIGSTGPHVPNQSPNPTPPASTDAAIASQIASIIGALQPATTPIVTDIILSDTTTIPIDANPSGLTGITTVVGSSTYLVIGESITTEVTIQPSSVSSGGNSTAPIIQATGSSMRKHVDWGVISSMLGACTVMLFLRL